jgi:CelD/BcsL family acetyltransferase involved in cellulose biosynthesis
VWKLSFLANGYSAECGFLLSKPEMPILLAIIDFLILHKHQWNLLELQNLDATGSHWNLVCNALESRQLKHRIRHQSRNLYVPIEGDWNSFLTTRSRRIQKRIKSRHNAIVNAGMTPIVKRLKAHDILGSMDDIFQISRNSWKAEIKRALTDRPSDQEFFRLLSKSLGMLGWVELWILYIGEQPAAFEYHVVYQGVTTPIRADFDLGFSRYSPGAYLEADILKSLFTSSERNITEYNSAGYQQYFRHWPTHVRENNLIWVLSPTLIGAFLYPLAMLRRPVAHKRRSA